MPHLDSETIRPLYDIHEGGSPRGFKCMLNTCDDHAPTGVPCSAPEHHCSKITRTVRGMYMHQARVHNVKRQLEIDFGEIKPTTE